MPLLHLDNPRPTPAAIRQDLLRDPGFGRIFSDHMVTIRWSTAKGWHDGKVEPRKPLMIDPAASVLHYAQEIFEGMKAFRNEAGEIALFRPEMNARRFNQSADRLAMPTIPEELFIEAIEDLVKIDKDWVPGGDGALYLRPFMFANEAFLGVRPANEYVFCVIASPVGAYFKAGRHPLTLWVTEHYSRAALGGTGAAKCGGNYAASLAAQAEAIKQGCDQVIFLDAKDHSYVEELGGMNIFFVFEDGSMITPPLGGTILPGITRASIIDLARARGHKVEEKLYAFADWKADAASGKLREVFACGTAAVITAIGEIRNPEGAFTTSPESTVTDALYEQLTGIQRLTTPGPDGWVRKVV